MSRFHSVELSRIAIFSVILTLAELICYNLTWPMLPPIVVMPFVTSFVLAMSIPFHGGQWIMGLVASLLTIVSNGGILPGPFMIPIYEFVFQTRRVKLSGAVSSIIHVVYGVFLAPLIFIVAPAKVVLNWLLVYVRGLVPAMIVFLMVFGMAGAIAASLGYGIGLRIAENLRERRYRNSPLKEAR